MRTFWFGSVRDLLSSWTISGTASGSVWNSSISSRANARPIRTVLVWFHMEPFRCKQGHNVSSPLSWVSLTVMRKCYCRAHTFSNYIIIYSLILSIYVNVHDEGIIIRV